jgi:phage N-6-adenine-methyltransferase
MDRSSAAKIAPPKRDPRTGEPLTTASPSRRAEHRFNNELRYRDAEHPDNTQFTPSYVLEPVRVDLGGKIDLDPCTTDENPTSALRIYTVEDDGLTRPWWLTFRVWSIFVNPPYSKAREPWVDRCIEAGAIGQKVVLLIPAATDTRIFQRAVSTSTAVVFIKGRVKFGTLRPNRRQHAASHPSALIGWNVDLDACSTLGWRTRP